MTSERTFVLYCRFNSGAIDSEMGRPDYSYWFVEQYFKGALEEMGHVVEISSERDFHEGLDNGAVALSFAPPQQTPVSMRATAIPVFAWEYGSVPSEPLGGDVDWDWPSVLSTCRGAIVHSSHLKELVESKVPHLPVECVVVPIYERFASSKAWVKGSSNSIRVEGAVWDSRKHLPEVRDEPHGMESESPAQLYVDGIVYTYVFNPMDGRKRWEEAVSAFVYALRDQHDACLLMKLVYHDQAKAIELIAEFIGKLGPFGCRIVLICGFLPGDDYRRMMEATTFALNTSCGEGQCLPLLEFMSAGRPAVSPNHTAMADYVNVSNSFVVEYTQNFVPFPNDPNLFFRTHNFPILWESLCEQFRSSFRIASERPEIYREKSENARMSARRVASIEVFKSRLETLIVNSSKDSGGGESAPLVPSQEQEGSSR